MTNRNVYKSKGMYILVLVVIIIGGVLLFTGCAIDQAEKTVDNAETTVLSKSGTKQASNLPTEIRGNTTGNIVQGGFVAESDGWFYFCMPDDTKLMKINADGSDLQVLADEEAMYINVIGDWIYYESGGSIIKIRTDGSERTVVDPYAAPLFLNVVDDWIYYYVVLDFDTGSGIYKIRVNGEEKTLLNDVSGFDLNKVGNWIYFSNWDDDRKPYKMSLKGEEVTMLTKDEAFCLQVYGNAVYYTDALNIYRVGIDGNDRKVLEISPYTTISFLIYDGWIYFFFPTSISLDVYDLLRVNPESSEIEVIAEITMPDEDTLITIFNIASGWIFFYAFVLDDDYETLYRAVYRMRTDGGGFEQILKSE